MDDEVKAAMARWPNVPAVYGWLSLDARGHWHIHPEGTAASGGPGEPITSPQINAFINRNYAAQPDGAWYFQNGPQRVFVRIDAAPLVLRVADSGIGLQAHTGQPVLAVSHWWLTDDALYASTGLGPAVLENRDLAAWLQTLQADGCSMLDLLEQGRLPAHGMDVTPGDGSLPSAPLMHVDDTDMAGRLGFVRLPQVAP